MTQTQSPQKGNDSKKDEAITLAKSLLAAGRLQALENLDMPTLAEAEAMNRRRHELEEQLATSKTPMDEARFDRLVCELVTHVMAATAKPPRQPVKLLRVKARPLVNECARRTRSWENWNELRAIDDRPAGRRCVIRNVAGLFNFSVCADSWLEMVEKLRSQVAAQDARTQSDGYPTASENA